MAGNGDDDTAAQEADLEEQLNILAPNIRDALTQGERLLADFEDWVEKHETESPESAHSIHLKAAYKELDTIIERFSAASETAFKSDALISKKLELLRQYLQEFEKALLRFEKAIDSKEDPEVEGLHIKITSQKKAYDGTLGTIETARKASHNRIMTNSQVKTESRYAHKSKVLEQASAILAPSITLEAGLRSLSNTLRDSPLWNQTRTSSLFAGKIIGTSDSNTKNLVKDVVMQKLQQTMSSTQPQIDEKKQQLAERIVEHWLKMEEKHSLLRASVFPKIPRAAGDEEGGDIGRKLIMYQHKANALQAALEHTLSGPGGTTDALKTSLQTNKLYADSTFRSDTAKLVEEAAPGLRKDIDTVARATAKADDARITELNAKVKADLPAGKPAGTTSTTTDSTTPTRSPRRPH